ncbi:hypothetical protein Lfu02_31410 [Longispora fulva]|uniref:Uncharacterized protein n=1 Tax=Longispora fulva TaxID=619741 RepID=A0A8J7KI30_9ACTN|nr:hypothetical protein [Longispora fulva]MBG6139275.1 hypothetical protein [Longispora fulva]GIG58769.1 hypothetical protein Lfu02_31410 [Longispora fulva]
MAQLLILAVGAALIWAAIYAAACAIWPFKNCPRCTGSGRKRSPTGRAWRDCKRCKGTGKRLRLGRKLLTHARATHARGTR